jgi:hypothetical protein
MFTEGLDFTFFRYFKNIIFRKLDLLSSTAGRHLCSVSQKELRPIIQPGFFFHMDSLYQEFHTYLLTELSPFCTLVLVLLLYKVSRLFFNF